MGRHLMGLREYARHRDAKGLPGTSLRAVQKAIATHRISVLTDDKGRQRIDPEVADIQWDRNTDPDQSVRANAGRETVLPGSASGEASGGRGEEREQSPYWDARTRLAVAEAAKAELQLEEMSGNLVRRERVERAAYEAGRLLRDMVLSVPSKIAAETAAMSDPQAVEARIRDELRKVLDELARLSRTGLEPG